MKSIVPFKKALLQALTTLILFFSFSSLLAQDDTHVGDSINGLVFKNPVLQSGQNLKKGAVYSFSNIKKGIDAKLTIVDLVGGASITNIDDNTGGLGYTNAFQPEIKPGICGESYAVFSIEFIDAITGLTEKLKSVQATALDIDGNNIIKEFAGINMSGGTAAYMGSTQEILLKSIPVLNSGYNEFRADNISGIEHDNIDTSGKEVMYTVNRSDISSIMVKYGAKSSNSSNMGRQYSLYLKGFEYPDQVILPLDLLSFNAYVNNNKVDLNWTTAEEKNVSHFAIEKSIDGKNFSDAATVFAIGNTSVNDKRNYSYSDQLQDKSISTIIYYRLRCIDADGKYAYSQVRVVRVGEKADGTKMMAYPNPFVNELRITLPQNLQGKNYKIELFNAGGQVVKAKNIISASQTETITTSDLGRGFYVIRITAGTEKMQYKVIKN